jgi:hypothetical protein
MLCAVPCVSTTLDTNGFGVFGVLFFRHAQGVSEVGGCRKGCWINGPNCQARASFAAPQICYTAPMTMLDKFMSFAKDLPADRLESVEESLAALMESLSERYEFTPDQLAELDQRMAEEHPEYASEDTITKIFGKPFRT